MMSKKHAKTTANASAKLPLASLSELAKRGIEGEFFIDHQHGEIRCAIFGG